MGTFWLISKADESQKGKLYMYMYVINAAAGHISTINYTLCMCDRELQ